MTRTFSGFLLAMITTVSVVAETVVVGPGQSYTSVQAGIDAAADGDTVLVLPGVYTIDEPIDINRLHVPGNPASAPLKNLTVTSEEGAAATTIRLSPNPKDKKRRSLVVFTKGETTSVLAGFTLVEGHGTLAGKPACPSGGAIFVSESSPRIESCVITGNIAAVGGGVFCGKASAPTLVGCTIKGNTARSSGGGVYAGEDSSPTLEECRLLQNYAPKGGGVFCGATSAGSLIRCRFEGNASKDGGGVLCASTVGCTISACYFLGNLGKKRGGGIQCAKKTSPVITNCDFTGNQAKKGGGVYCDNGSTPTLVNCTVAGNGTKKLSGVGCHKKSRATVINSIVSDPANFILYADVLACFEQDAKLETPGEFDFKRTVKMTLSGRKRKMPDFILDPPDHHLTVASLAIDAGVAEGAPGDDIEGYGRPCLGGYDIGAYEFGRCVISRDLFWRGDTDGNAAFNITDAIYTLNYLAFGGPAPGCMDAADVDDSGDVGLTDAVYALNHLFLGGKPLAVPYLDCGLDPTLDPLDCAIPTVCP